MKCFRFMQTSKIQYSQSQQSSRVRRLLSEIKEIQRSNKSEDLEIYPCENKYDTCNFIS